VPTDPHDGTVDATCDYFERLGKIPDNLPKDVLGFTINWIQAVFMNEAWDVYMYGWSQC
jgi:3-hydroxyacyl-CoA dehydrogenase